MALAKTLVGRLADATSWREQASLPVSRRRSTMVFVQDGIEREVDMTLISSEGIVLIGPGSEWFWTAVSGVVLATTFLAIYRQLRLQANSSAIEQMNSFDREAASERASRAKLILLVALREGADPAGLPDAAAAEVAASWEKIATLTRAGHANPKLLWKWTGRFAENWWLMLEPWIVKRRAKHGDPTLYQNLEWLAAVMRRMDIAAGIPPASMETLVKIRDDVIVELRDLIRAEEELRTVMIAPGPDSLGLAPVHVGPARRPQQRPGRDDAGVGQPSSTR